MTESAKESTSPATLDAAPPARSKAGGHARGRRVAIGIFLLGLVGATIARVRWASVEGLWHERGMGAKHSPPPAGGYPEDELKKIVPLYESLATGVQEMLNEPRLPADVLPKVQAFAKEYPRFSPARQLLAQVLIKEMRPAEGLEELEACLKLDPGQPEIALMAGTLALDLGKEDQAGRYYEMAVKLNPAEPRYHVHAGALLLRVNRLNEAKACLEQALRLDAGYALAHWRLAEVQARLGHPRVAAGLMDKALEHSKKEKRPVQIQYTRIKARFLRQAGQAEDALRTLLEGLSDAERAEAPVLKEMAEDLASLERYEQAATLYERQAVEHPLEYEYLLQAARWRAKAGDKPAARKHLAAVRRLDPSLPELAEMERRVERGE